MKKLVSLLVALCMVFMTFSALAEGAAGFDMSSLLNGLLSGEEAEGGEGAKLDLSGVLGMFSGEGSEGGESVDLSGLLGMFSGEGGESVDLSGVLGMFSGENGESVDLNSLLGMFTGEDGEGVDLNSLLGMFTGEDGKSVDLNSLLGMFSGEGGEGVDLSGVLGMFSGEGGEGVDLSGLLKLFTGENGEEAETTVKGPVFAAAESAEQFFGVWNLYKATIYEVPIALEDVASLLDVPLTLQLVIADGSFTFTDGSEGEIEAEAAQMELVDGALQVTKNDEAFILRLTDAGELVLDIEIVALYFTPVSA